MHSPPPDEPSHFNATAHWRSLQDAIRRSWPNRHGRSSDVATLVGCSGGADSVALIRLLAELWAEDSAAIHTREPNRARVTAPLIVAHCNHGLRGEESDADEAFVRELCQQLQLPCLTHSVCVPNETDASPPANDEGTLRQIRRKFFQQTAQQHGCRYVALAHSADDQAETMLHHFIRGTGPLGLAGIAETSDLDTDLVVRRPLLQVRRETLRAGLREIGQTWREDASNQLTHYTRNWLRHDVLPLIEDRYPTAIEAMHRAARLQRETNEMLRRLADQWLETYSGFADDQWIIHTRRLANSTQAKVPSDEVATTHDWTTERPIIVTASQLAWDRLGWPRGAMTMEHWQRLAQLATAATTTFPATDTSMHRGPFPGGITLRLQPDCLVLRRQ
ncbi:tRNA lysidine(34) synthetase TilS [Rhodopirellula sp. P2]|uniref:tRNA lysidine(34) synthetase TilS n=1 Tax=Rhodopirellula sp. P2 TaxID=2127060 RepID=UPI002367E678|nr:tRNA lysidine(34) synthetase TilS [Rhodopirellula sp. P2]WDQ18527.1 tRNA lysidine(34) synthetase TilS [Rhodopirellula sp. P2]